MQEAIFPTVDNLKFPEAIQNDVDAKQLAGELLKQFESKPESERPAILHTVMQDRTHMIKVVRDALFNSSGERAFQSCDVITQQDDEVIADHIVSTVLNGLAKVYPQA